MYVLCSEQFRLLIAACRSRFLQHLQRRWATRLLSLLSIHLCHLQLDLSCGLCCCGFLYLFWLLLTLVQASFLTLAFAYGDASLHHCCRCQHHFHPTLTVLIYEQVGLPYLDACSCLTVELQPFL